MSDELFKNPQFDAEKFAREIARKPAAACSYVLYFTPRSGSSWLGDILKSTGRLGNPGEWFNPNFIPNITKSINARNAETYLEILRRRQAPGGLFGLEITYFQLNKVFADNARFFDLFSPHDPSFYLVREDIVAQAVSLSKAVLTGVFHTAGVQDDALRDSEVAYEYDADHIRQWLNHIRSMEIRTEAFFTAFGVTPRRLTYERVTGEGGVATARAFARVLDAGTLAEQKPVSAHRKIGTPKNIEFAERFRREQPALVREMDTARQPLIAAARHQQDALFQNEIAAAD